MAKAKKKTPKIGRPRLNGVNVQVNVPKNVLVDIDVLIAESRMSRSAVFTVALEEYLKNRK